MIGLHNWKSGVPVLVGHWHPEPFSRTVSGRCYTSDWCPKDLTGRLWGTTHDGQYCTMVVGGCKVNFHTQLWKDHNMGWQQQFRNLHVHHKEQAGVDKKDWPLNSSLAILEGMERQLHLKRHAPEGGRPAE